MHDVKVLFLIPEIKILSILRAAGERGMHQHLHNFRFQQQQWGNVKDQTVIYEALALNLMPTRWGSVFVGWYDAGDGDSNEKRPTIITRRRIVHCMHRWRECDHGSSTARLRTAQSPPKQPLRKTNVRNFFYDILNDCLLLRGGRVSRWEGYCWWHRRYLFILNNTCTRAQIVAFLYRAYKG